MLASVSLSLLLAAADPAPTASPDPDGFAGNLEPDAVEAPPGSPADRALWRELRDGTAFSTLQLARVAQVSFRLRYGRYFEELEARAKAPGDGSEPRRLLADLRAAVARARERIPSQPGIYPCRHALLALEVRMKGLPDPKAEAELPETRAKARDCADRMKGILAAAQESAAGLEDAMARADAYLKRVVPAVAPDRKVPAARETLDGMEEGKP